MSADKDAKAAGALRELWEAAIRAKADAAAAAARADRLSATFNEALAAAHARRLVPPGYQIDYLGDGTVKPTDRCRQIPATGDEI